MTLASFELASLWPRKLRDNLPVGTPFRLANSGELSLYPTSDWSVRFPGNVGYFTLSSVGFNLAGTQALIHLEHHCGLSSHGGFVLLEKSGGRWKIVGEALTWVA